MGFQPVLVLSCSSYFLHITKPHSYCDITDKVQAALLYNEEGDSILSQISRLVPVDDVDKITVLSPFFDDNGATLENLLQLCPHAKMDVLIQQDCALPPYKMQDSNRMCFFDFDETKRGKVGIKNYERVAHAKVLVFHTDTIEYCVVGSANATIAGLGTMNRRGRNEEFCVLYASDSMNYLNQLGLKPAKRHVIDHTKLEFSRTAKASDTKATLRLISANRENGCLAIVVSDMNALPKTFSVIVEDRNGRVTFVDYRIDENIIQVKLNASTKTDVGICYIESSEGSVMSNKILVNNIEELETTNPSPTVRMLNRFVSKIESDGYNGLDVIDMLTDVMFNVVDEDDEIEHENRVKSTSKCLEKTKENVLPAIEYNSEYDNDDVAFSRNSKEDYASRLIECIEESIRLTLRKLEEEGKDEEEEADSQTSHERVCDDEGTLEVIEDDIDILVEKSSKVLRSYQNLLRRKSCLYKTSNGKLSKDDLNFFSLSFFSAMEICCLKRFMYEFDTVNKMELSYMQKKLYDRLDGVMERTGIEVFVEFCQFCKRFGNGTKRKSEFGQPILRVMRYALVFLTFIHRQSQPYYWNKILNSMKELVHVFGMPIKEELNASLQPLMERYDYAFKFSYIECAVKDTGIDW